MAGRAGVLGFLGYMIATSYKIASRFYSSMSEILQLIEIKELLVVTYLCNAHGMMEWWNNGIVGHKSGHVVKLWAKKSDLIFSFFL